MSKTLTEEEIKEYEKEPKITEIPFMERESVRKTKKKDEVDIFINDFDRFLEMMSKPPVPWEKRLVHKRNMRKGTNLDPSNPDHMPLMYETENLKMEKVVAQWKGDKWRCTAEQERNGIDCFTSKYHVTKEFEQRVANIARLNEKQEEILDALKKNGASPVEIKKETTRWNKKIKKEMIKKVDLFTIDFAGKKIPVLKEITLPMKGKTSFLTSVDTDGVFRVPVKNRDGTIKKDRKTKQPIIHEYKPDEEGRFICSDHQPLQIRIMGPIKPVHAITKAIIDLNDKAAIPVNHVERTRDIISSLYNKIDKFEEILATVSKLSKSGSPEDISSLKRMFSGKKFEWSESKERGDVLETVSLLGDAIIKNKNRPDVFKDPKTGISWTTTQEELGLSKLFIEKTDRDNGALCSDTIRAYFNPKGTLDESDDYDEDEE